jgi:quercetin dioxygenase-like cupin family protein
LNGYVNTFLSEKVRFVHTENMTIAHWDIRAGSILPAHSHQHEQVTQVIEGEFELTVENDTSRMGPNTVAVIEPHQHHTGRAVSACRIIDVFYPVREDYR